MEARSSDKDWLLQQQLEYPGTGGKAKFNTHTKDENFSNYIILKSSKILH